MGTEARRVRTRRWISVAVVVAPIAFLVRMCFFPYTSEVERAISPDGKWLATSTFTDSLSAFDPPLRYIVLGGTSLSDWGSALPVFEWPFGRIMAIRWLDNETLEVAVEDAGPDNRFLPEDQHFENVTIRYKVVPWSR